MLKTWMSFLLLLALPLAVAAQTTQYASEAELEQIISEARAAGSQVLVIQPTPGEELVATDDGPGLRVLAIAFSERLQEIFAASDGFFSHVYQTVRSHHEGRWVMLTVFWTLVFVAVGYGAEWLFNRWGRSYFKQSFNEVPQHRSEKISYLLLRGVMQEVGVAIQMGVALLLVVIFDPGEGPVRDTAFIVIVAIAVVRALSVFFRNLFADDTPSHRLLNLSDADATQFHRALVIVFTAAAVILGVCGWMQQMGISDEAHQLSLLVGTLIGLVLLLWVLVANRKVVAGMILGPGDPDEKSFLTRVVAGSWHVVAVIYILFAMGLQTFRETMGLADQGGIVVGTIILLFGAIAVYGVALLIIEAAFERYERQQERKRAEALAKAEKAAAEAAAERAEADKAAAIEAGIEAEAIAEPELDDDDERYVPPPRPRRTFKDLARQAAALLVIVGALAAILGLWGLDINAAGGFANAMVDILLIAFITYLASASVNIYVDKKTAEAALADAGRQDEEGAAAGVSRVATLLPLFRNFVLITIFVMGTMIILSEMGVDIAPLFAGAGVIGLAIGFGAQTLVRDIFSGAFFLMDDAFRVGEYIDLGSTKGTVEKISIRSMQLRHHRGALNTIPFGEIRQITNYARDWVIMKLPLRLTYDTDIDKVRKLIKKLGQELLEHPEYGDKFLEPVKSQGVYMMEDSAMILRVKFKTKPGDQFLIRKDVYAKIRELFEKNDIHFAHKEVLVRVAHDDDKPSDQKELEAAAAAAAQSATQPPPAPAAAGDTR